MTRKERLEYQRWRREMVGPQFAVREQEMLILLGKLRTFTYRSDQGSDPMSLALQALQKAIDDVAEVLTSNREYFWAMHHSIAESDAAPAA